MKSNGILRKQPLRKPECVFLSKVLSIFLAVVIVAALSGCAHEKYPENAIAVINKTVVTEEQVNNLIRERELYIKIMKKYMEEPDAQIITPAEGMLIALDTTEKQLNAEQKRYYEYLKKRSIPMTENEAFNKAVRDEVLYQEAVKQGFEVAEEKALEILKASDAESLKTASNSPEELKEYERHLNIESEVLKEYGFQTREDYWYVWHLPESAKASSINMMKEHFIDKVARIYPNLPEYEREIMEHNAWEDYTEYLIRDYTKIKSLNPTYSLSFTGQDWQHGRWDYP